MMALSLINITPIGPAAPTAPPGVALAVDTFDLLMPIADPTDPRHEPAADGKGIGKDMPVTPTETPSPLAWLPPPVAPRVSKPLPAQHGKILPVVAPIAPAPLPPAVDERSKAVSSASPSAPATDVEDEDETTITAAITPNLPLPLIKTAATAAAAKSPTIARAIPAVTTEAVRQAAPTASPLAQPLPALADEASTIPPPVAPAPKVPAETLTTPESESPTIVAPTPKSSDAAPARQAPDLPKPASRDVSVAIELRLPALVQPAVTLITPRIAPAAQVFADAIHRATRDDRTPASPEAATLATASDIKTHAVAATADAQHGALDMGHEQWPARMIERIDALRDAANANDTSIRLIPDALGKIDVSLKRDGDTVAVHFAAQHAETRQLLADSAPKLAELAEARGLKLAQSGTDTAGQQQQRQQPTTSVAKPRSAPVDDTESSDTRIA